MDFGQFNTKKGAEEGKFLHLRHLQTGEFLFEEVDGKKEPVGITLRGLESKTVKEAVAQYRRDIVEGKDDGDDEDAIIAKALVVSFHHIERDGKPLTTENADLKWFFEQSDELIKVCVNFARKAGNFLPAK